MIASNRLTQALAEAQRSTSIKAYDCGWQNGWDAGKSCGWSGGFLCGATSAMGLVALVVSVLLVWRIL